MARAFDLVEALQVLERTPSVLRAWLIGLGDAWLHGDYGPNTFTPYDIVGHLIHGEQTDWLERTRIILEHGTSRPFTKYDRYAMFEDSRGKTIAQLLDEFEQLRKSNLTALRALHLKPAQLSLRGRHSVLGEVTLEQLLSTWVAHDLNHLGQIARCMASQYGEAVGPWSQFLGILKSPVTQMDAEGAKRAERARSLTRGGHNERG